MPRTPSSTLPCSAAPCRTSSTCRRSDTPTGSCPGCRPASPRRSWRSTGTRPRASSGKATYSCGETPRTVAARTFSWGKAITSHLIVGQLGPSPVLMGAFLLPMGQRAAPQLLLAPRPWGFLHGRVTPVLWCPPESPRCLGARVQPPRPQSTAGCHVSVGQQQVPKPPPQADVPSWLSLSPTCTQGDPPQSPGRGVRQSGPHLLFGDQHLFPLQSPR